MTIAQFDQKVLGVIRRNPGSRADEIADRLREAVPPISAALRRLRRRGRLVRQGYTRGTTYRAK